MSFDTSGVDRLARQLAAAAPKVIAGVRAGVTAAAANVQASAQDRAPVRTGTLRASISTHASGLSAEVTATAPYASFVEYGTSRMPAEPFMAPAAEAAAVDLIKAATAAALAALP